MIKQYYYFLEYDDWNYHGQLNSNSVYKEIYIKKQKKTKQLMSRKPEWESCLYAHKYYFSNKYWPHLYTLDTNKQDYFQCNIQVQKWSC